jgi:hypothetical protein
MLRWDFNWKLFPPRYFDNCQHTFFLLIEKKPFSILSKTKRKFKPRWGNSTKICFLHRSTSICKICFCQFICIKVVTNFLASTSTLFLNMKVALLLLLLFGKSHLHTCDFKLNSNFLCMSWKAINYWNYFYHSRTSCTQVYLLAIY